jgi:Fe-Mn family superoxide dismutase
MKSITRREALRVLGAGTAALAGSGAMSRALANGGSADTPATPPPAAAAAAPAGPFTLPPLPYAYEALEPSIDRATMEIHHNRHHQAYVTNLNKAIAGQADLEGKSIETILTSFNTLPESIRTAVRNNGGGHANHTLFWEIMGPGKGGVPKGALADALNGTFGSFVKFQETMAAAATSRFGSGWAWLAQRPDGTLEVYSTANQDSPLMEGKKPILGLDLWEHAYYLKYQNKRADYVTAWWNVVNWDAVAARLG